MKLEKAISVNTRLAKELDISQRAEERKAVKLGIKALERIQGLRSAEHYIGMPLLKGETKE